MKVGDEAHVALIKECREKGHDWNPWESVKFISGEERQCKRCKLNECTIQGTSSSYAIGSTWLSAKSVDAQIP